jgi:GNAT superfamily N-acetyltransferase
VRCFEYFLEGVIAAGTVWAAGQALGATAWIAPGEMGVWRDAHLTETRMHELTEDGGRRYDAFWAWVDARAPDEPLWFLDSVGVAPQARGRGIGGALIRSGLERARADGVDAFLDGQPWQCPDLRAPRLPGCRSCGRTRRRPSDLVPSVVSGDTGPVSASLLAPLGRRSRWEAPPGVSQRRPAT